MKTNYLQELKWRFVKTSGIDRIVLINQNVSPVEIRSIRLTLNIGIGTSPNGASLDTDTPGIQGIPEEQKKLKKERRFREYQLENPQINATDHFLNPWGSLARYSSKEASYTRLCVKNNNFTYTVTYEDKPHKIEGNLSATFNYVNSFRYLMIESPIKGMSMLPSVEVKLDGSDEFVPVALESIVETMGQKRTRVIDRAMAGRVTAAAFPRRVQGYYANYFAYGRDIFVADLPYQYINQISYGMLSMEPDGTPVSSDIWGDDWQICALQFIKRLNPDLKVFLIVGGWPKEITFDIRQVVDLKSDLATTHEYAGSAPDVSFLVAPGKKAGTSEILIRFWTAFEIGGRTIYPAAGPARPLREMETAHLNVPDEDANVLIEKLITAVQSVVEFYGYQTLPFGAFDASNRLKIMLPLAELVGIPILPASALFSTIGTSEAAADNFAKHMADAVKALGFDGVEIDWEYPRDTDAEGYIRILSALRKALGRDGRISIAAPAGSKNINALSPATWTRIGRLADEINMMTYDYAGGWSARSDFNTPIQAVCQDSDIDSISTTVTAMLKLVDQRCFSRRQLSLGLAAYGRAVAVEGGNTANKGLDCKVVDQVPGQFPEQPGTYLYSFIAEAEAFDGRKPDQPQFGYDGRWQGIAFQGLHPTARSPFGYLLGERSTVSLTYDNPASVREKVRYARTLDLGGVMIWDLSGDLPASDPRSLLRAVGEELRLEQPPTRAVKIIDGTLGGWDEQMSKSSNLPPLPTGAVARDYGGRLTMSKADLPANIGCMARLPCDWLAVGQTGKAEVALLARDISTDPPQWRRRAVITLRQDARGLLALADGRLVILQADGSLWLAVNGDSDHVLTLIREGDLVKAGAAPLLAETGDGSFVVGRAGRLALYLPDGTGFALAFEGEPLGGGCQITGLCALPQGRLAVGGDTVEPARGNSVLSVCSVAPEGGRWKVESHVPRRPDQDWGALCSATTLSDGRLAVLTAYGEVLMWNHGAFGADGTLAAPSHVYGAPIGEMRARFITPLPQGGFFVVTDGAWYFWAADTGAGFAMTQHMDTTMSADGVAVLADGTIVVARTNSLTLASAPGWPLPAVLRGPWNHVSEKGETWLHRLAASGTPRQMEQALAAGAPADLASPGADDTLIAVALGNKQPGLVAPLLEAGARLWGTDVGLRHGRALSEGMLAAFAPPALQEALPHLIADLPADERVHAAPWPEGSEAFFTGNPQLAMASAHAVLSILPTLADRLTTLVSEYVIDADALAAAAGDGDNPVIRYVPDAAGKSGDTAPGAGQDLRAILDSMRGRSFADQFALEAAIKTAWKADEAEQRRRQPELDQIAEAAIRIKKDVIEDYHCDYDASTREEAARRTLDLLDRIWSVPGPQGSQPLSQAAPVQYRMIVQAVRDSLLPAGYDSPVLRAASDRAPSDLPRAVADFLALCPWMRDSLEQEADRLVSGLGATVRTTTAAGVTDGTATGLPAREHPLTALRESSGGPALAAKAMQALLMWGTHDNREGGAPLTPTQAAAFLASHAHDPWVPEGDLAAYRVEWANWTQTPPFLAPDPVTAVEAVIAASTGNAPAALANDRARALPTISPATVEPDYDGPTDKDASRQVIEDLKAMKVRTHFEAELRRDKYRIRSADLAELGKAQGQMLEIQSLQTRAIGYQALLDRQNKMLAEVGAAHREVAAGGTRVHTLDSLGFNKSPLPGVQMGDHLNAAQLDELKTYATSGKIKLENNIMDLQDTLEDKKKTYGSNSHRLELMERQRKFDKLTDLQNKQMKVASITTAALQITSIARRGVEWLESSDRISASTAETLNTVLDITDKVIRIGAAVADAALVIQQAKLMGGVGGWFTGIGAVFSVVSTIVNIFWPQPDPVIEGLKAISKQIGEVYKALSDQMVALSKQVAALSDQMASMEAGLDKRLTGLEDKLDGLSRDIAKQLDQVVTLMDSGFASSRAEVRRSTQLILVSMARGFDSVQQRMDLMELRFESDLHYLQQMMSVELMNAYQEIDVTIAKAEVEATKHAGGDDNGLHTLKGPPLADDGDRLLEYRNRLLTGIRTKLLGLQPKLLEDDVPTDLLRSFPVATGQASQLAATTAVNRFGACYNFFQRTRTGTAAPGQGVYFSASYGSMLAGRLLWVMERYAKFVADPAPLVADIDELLLMPLKAAADFLGRLPNEDAFFTSLFQDYGSAMRSLAARGATILPADMSQSLRFAPSVADDAAEMLAAMTDRLPRLDLTSLQPDSIASNRPVQRGQHLAALHRFLTSPSLGWRTTKVLRAVTLGHALGVADLSLQADDTSVLLWVSAGDSRSAVARLQLVGDMPVGAEFLMAGHSLAIRIQNESSVVQRQWVAGWARRMVAECQAEMDALDGTVVRLILFMTLAGLSEQGIAPVLGLLWHSGRVTAYLNNLAQGEGDQGHGMEPPLPLLADYSQSCSRTAADLLRKRLTMAAAADEDDVLRSNLASTLLADINGLIARTSSLKTALRSPESLMEEVADMVAA